MMFNFHYHDGMHKQRLTVTVDPELVDAGNRAVEEGLASSLSGWVSSALAQHVEKERRLRAMREAIAAYEAEFGAITDAEMAAQARADRRDAVVIRGAKAKG